MRVEHYTREKQVEQTDAYAYEGRCLFDPEVRATLTHHIAVLDVTRVFAIDFIDLEHFDERPAVDDQVIHNFRPDSEQEDHEPVVVVDADAIVDPRAVMVKPIDALVANRTVAAARGADHFALWAQVCRVDVSQQVQKVFPWVALDGARVPARSVEECQDYEESSAD